MLLEKDCQIHDLENKLGEYIASLEFQKSVKKCKMLELYAAVISVQGLLLENLSMSKTLSKSECIQILEAHNPVSNEVVKRKSPCFGAMVPCSYHGGLLDFGIAVLVCIC